MVTKTFDEIIQSFLTFLIRRNDLIDIKPTAITRTFLDSIANELAVVNNEIENVRTIQTVINADQMTDQEMDNLASNFGVLRKEATFATVDVSFYLTRQPRQDITVPEGTIVATATSPALSSSVQFATIQTITMFADRINSYFNPNTGFYEISAPARALTPGSAGNVTPNSLSRSVRSFNSGSDLVLATNKASGIGGTDQENNTDLAARIFVSISGINVGTKDGYKSSALITPGVVDAVVVGAGDPMMVRDYNSLGEHIGGRVDVYIEGQDQQASQDRVTFDFQKKFGQYVNLIQGTNLEFSAADSDLNTFPLVSIDRIYTIIDNPIFQFENQIKPNANDISNAIHVTIVNPLGGSIVDGGVNVTVRAFKEDGSIKRVNLIINKNEKQRMLFNNDVGLFFFLLNTAQYPDGVIQLEAEAFDERNEKGVSEPVLVTVQNLEDISVRILSPDAGTTITGALNVQAYAFSTKGISLRGMSPSSVEIRFNEGRWWFMNPTNVPTVFTYPLVASNFRSGPVKVEVRATDNRQRTAYSLPRYYIVETGPATTLQSNEVRTITVGSFSSHTIVQRSGDVGMVVPFFPATPLLDPIVQPIPSVAINTGTALSPIIPTATPVGPVIVSAASVPPPVQPTAVTPTANIMKAAGSNTNLAKLINPSDPKFSEGDIEYQNIIDDKQAVVPINKHMYDIGGEWVGTDGVGLAFSTSGGKTFEMHIHSGNTINWKPQDDYVTLNGIAKNQTSTYIGTNGSAYITNDRVTFNRVPLPTDKPITAFGFIKFS